MVGCVKAAADSDSNDKDDDVHDDVDDDVDDAIVVGCVKPEPVSEADKKPAADTGDEFDGISDDAVAGLFDSMENDQDAKLYQKLAKESNKLPTMYGGTVDLLDESSSDSDSSSDSLFPPSPFAKAAAAAKKGKADGKAAASLQGRQLKPAQLLVLEEVKRGRNVFVTGKGWTGKSVVIHKIMKQEGQTRNGVVVTSTGMTAYNFGKEVKALTLYKYANIGHPTSLTKFKQYFKLMAQKWLNLNFIVMEEVSMFPGNLLDWMDHYVRRARKSVQLETGQYPVFQGIQVICVGDFGQLGPIPKKVSTLHHGEVQKKKMTQEGLKPSTFGFEDQCTAIAPSSKK